MEEEIQKEIPTSYTLKTPVKWVSGDVDVVSITPLKGKHLKKMKAKPDMGDMHTLVHHMIDMPQSFVDELASQDFMALVGIVGDFLGAGPETGSEI